VRVLLEKELVDEMFAKTEKNHACFERKSEEPLKIQKPPAKTYQSFEKKNLTVSRGTVPLKRITRGMALMPVSPYKV
jgi:hypothetical protein